ncbi:protrudin isoform X3 [Ursus americanus]|uniref:protrudin isoform X3 n=1 Tax=Ursus americanus TaxID=9643 RepID=UPI001E67D574|nr:protrudin isoform X3 [Ursus americanus]
MQVTVSGTCSGAWYSVGALMISVPALLGYLQEVCRARLPESELMRRKYHSVRQEDLQKVRLSRPEAVAEVKSFLIQLEAFLSRLCRTCEAAYRVLHWENPAASSQFYGALLGTVCMLYLLPLCWVLALLNSTLFLGNVEFFRVVSEYRACLQRRLNPKQKDSVFESPPLPEAGEKCALPDCTPAPTPTEDLTPGSVEEAEEAEPDEEFKDAIEVGGPSPPLSTDQDRSQVVWEPGGFSHPRCRFFSSLYPNEKSELVSWSSLDERVPLNFRPFCDRPPPLLCMLRAGMALEASGKLPAVGGGSFTTEAGASGLGALDVGEADLGEGIAPGL